CCGLQNNILYFYRTIVISNNKIHGFRDSYGSELVGIYDWGNNTASTIRDNEIYDLVNLTGWSYSYGIWAKSISPSNIFKNKIYDLSGLGSDAKVFGLYYSSSATGVIHNIYNNYIGNLTAPAADSGNCIYGIYLESTATYNLCYNTVYINASSSGPIFGTTAVYAATSSHVTMQNNLLVNTSIPTGSGKVVAYRRDNAILSTYNTVSNNNYFYAGSPAPNRLIYYDGTLSAQTLFIFKAYVTPTDSASKTSASTPAFISTTGSDAQFLHLNGGVPSVLESGGMLIPGYNDDYDGDVRAGSPGYPLQLNYGGTAPDIGADEFDGYPDMYTTIAENSDNIISIFPNPVSDNLLLEMNKNFNAMGFRIFNSLGEIVFTGTITDKVVIPLMGFSKGLYVIGFDNGYTSKFIKI
ncbi:MAG: T9SS type A sorting domain-containing protein, partial [Bacteroidota bacterium]